MVASIASKQHGYKRRIRVSGISVDRRRDEQVFPTLKDEKQFDTSWHCSTLAQTRSQAVANILDPSFTNGSDEEEKKSTALNYDSQFVNAGVCRTQRQAKRAVCNHDIATSKLEQYDIGSTTIEVLQDGTYDIDSTPIEVLQSSNAHSRVPGSNMSKDKWERLNSDAQQL